MIFFTRICVDTLSQLRAENILTRNVLLTTRKMLKKIHQDILTRYFLECTHKRSARARVVCVTCALDILFFKYEIIGLQYCCILIENNFKRRSKRAKTVIQTRQTATETIGNRLQTAIRKHVLEAYTRGSVY